MQKKIRAQVDIKGFGEVVKGLSKITGRGFKKTLRSELGHIFVGAIKKTPIATSKKIAKWTLPEGVKSRYGVGGRVVTYHDGKYKHAGQLVLASVGPRGGNVFAKPYPKRKGSLTRLQRKKSGQAWISKYRGGGSDGGWAKFVKEQKEKTKERVARKGMTAGTFYWMASRGKIQFPRKPKAFKEISSNAVRKLVHPTTRAVESGTGFKYTMMVESQGLKVAKVHSLQYKLTGQIGSRIKFFKTNMRRGFLKDMKKFMPKNYPLLVNKNAFEK